MKKRGKLEPGSESDEELPESLLCWFSPENNLTGPGLSWNARKGADASKDGCLSGVEIFVDVLEKLRRTLGGLRESQLKGDGPDGVSLTGVHIGVLLGTHELPLKLKCVWGDSSGLDSLLAE